MPQVVTATCQELPCDLKKDKTRQRVNKGVWRDPRRLYGEMERTLCASVCSSNPAGCDSRSACLRFSKGFLLLLSSSAACFATARSLRSVGKLQRSYASVLFRSNRWCTAQAWHRVSKTMLVRAPKACCGLNVAGVALVWPRFTCRLLTKSIPHCVIYHTRVGAAVLRGLATDGCNGQCRAGAATWRRADAHA